MLQPDDSLISFAPDHLGTEQALQGSGLGWTFLRNSWYMEALTFSLPAALAAGTWYTAVGEGRLSYVAREDCARAAAAALASPDSANGRYDITGGELLTTSQIAGIASRVFQKPLRLDQLTDAQLADGMRAQGVPPPMVDFLVAFDTNTRAGKVATCSDAVQKLTGTAPQTLEAFLTAHRAAFVPAAV